MGRAMLWAAVLAGLALSGCAAPESGDFTAPRDGDPEGPYDTVGSRDPTDSPRPAIPTGEGGGA